MTWDTTDLTNYNDIIIQDGVFAYNFTASGTIYKGQSVTLDPAHDNRVMVCASDAIYSNSIGLATGDATTNTQIAIAGPGNICWACCDTGTDIYAGVALYGDTYGVLDAAAGNATKVAGYALNTSTAGTTNYIVKVLLV